MDPIGVDEFGRLLGWEAPPGDGGWGLKRIMLGFVAVAFVIQLTRVTAGANAERDGVDRLHTEPVLVAADSSGTGNDGINQGRPIIGLPGQRGTSYSFDRPGSWIQVASDPSLNPGRRDFWFTAWVNLAGAPDVDDTYDIVRKGFSYTDQGEYKIEIVPGGYVRCTAKDDRRRVAVTTDRRHTVTDGRWHRIGCARAGNTWSVIVGKALTSKRVRLGAVGNTLPLSIGSKYGREDLPSGRIDEVGLRIVPRTDELSLPPPLWWFERPAIYPAVGLWHLDEEAASGA